MRISTPKTPVRPQAAAAAGSAKKPAPQGDVQKIVEATVDKTLAGTDRMTGTLAGAATGVTGFASKLPSLVGDTAVSIGNLIKAETIGPNIKVVAGIASPILLGIGLVGAGMGLAVSAAGGAIMGFNAHDVEKPREFTIGKAVDTTWNKVRANVDEMGDDALTTSKSIREKKLAEGEDPWDIPLPPFGRTAQTMAATVAGIAIGGVGGVATAIATTAKGAWDGIKHTASNLSSPADAIAGLGAVVAAPVTGVLEGATKVLTTPIEAAAVAWKEKSLGNALKAAGKEAFTADAGKLPSAAGAFVGGAVIALPSAAATTVATAATTLGKGVSDAVTDKELNLPAKALAAAGSVVGAPLAGIVHGATTAVGTPLGSLSSAWDKSSLVDGMASGLKDTHSFTKISAEVAGAAAGGLVIGGATAVPTLGAALASQVVGGIADAASNSELNAIGKVLDGAGGILGDTVTAVGQGIGTLVASPIVAAGETGVTRSASDGIRKAAKFGVNSVKAGANPEKHMVKTVEI